MNRTRKTVLVVDDNHVNRVVLTKLLETGGYEAKTATDGEEALAALEDAPVDAILLDLVMPGIGGIEVLRTVKGSARHWRTPVIVVSAVEETDSVVRCLELGAEDYLTRPFDPVILRARLDACLARQRFHDLEGEYQTLVEEQAVELQRLQLALEQQADRDEAPPAPRRARRGVVVVGLGGLGALVPRLPPEEALRVASTFQATVTETAARLGATLGGMVPEVVTLLVAEVAMAPALARSCVEDLGPSLVRWRDEHDAELVTGAGVAAGDVLVGAVGDPVRSAVLGRPVDVAQILCRQALAQGGGVVVDEGFAAT